MRAVVPQAQRLAPFQPRRVLINMGTVLLADRGTDDCIQNTLSLYPIIVRFLRACARCKKCRT
jgi:hypothetical protein